MHEQAKIEEARHFLRQLSIVVNERGIFNYTLSGFLSAARSALQYTHKEAKPKTDGQAWYDGQISAHPLVKFFKCKRNVNIHEKPISPPAKITVGAKNNVSLSESVSVTIFRADGTTETRHSASPSRSSPQDEPEASVTYDYFFEDWSGNEDVITLCQRYLREVEIIVADGVTKKLLTP
jgi:hypothetical protein